MSYSNVETIATTESGLELRIWQDDCTESPRDWDNRGIMACWHRRYNLGDGPVRETPKDYIASLVYAVAPAIADNLKARVEGYDYVTKNHYLTEEEYEEKLWDLAYKHYVILPLYLYDHSGLSMNTGGFSCSWDSGQVGYIHMEKSDILREGGKPGAKNLTKKLRAWAESVLESEVSAYDDYLRGNVWGFSVVNSEGDVLDSCGGFLGYSDCPYFLQQGRASLALCEEQAQKEFSASLCHGPTIQNIALVG